MTAAPQVMHSMKGITLSANALSSDCVKRLFSFITFSPHQFAGFLSALVKRTVRVSGEQPNVVAGLASVESGPIFSRGDELDWLMADSTISDAHACFSFLMLSGGAGKGRQWVASVSVRDKPSGTMRYCTVTSGCGV